MTRWPCLVAALMLAAGTLAHARQPGFWGVGHLPGGDSSTANGVSGDGRIVVGGAEYGNFEQAFRWTFGGGIERLGDLPGGEENGTAASTNYDGSVIVGSSRSANGWEGFQLTSGGSMLGLGGLGIYNYSYAGSVSDDGRVVVGVATAIGTWQAFRWTAETGMLGLGNLPGGTVSIANDISADGSIIVGSDQVGFSSLGFRWSESDGLRIIGGTCIGGGIHGRAAAVSADGKVIAGDSCATAFRWTEQGGMQRLGLLPGGRSSFAYATSGDGSVVVGAATVEDDQHAFIWDARHGMRHLGDFLESLGIDLGGWHLDAAGDISRDGTVIVGRGRNPLGQVEGWVAVLPEPSGTLAIAALLLAALCRAPARKPAWVTIR